MLLTRQGPLTNSTLSSVRQPPPRVVSARTDRRSSGGILRVVRWPCCLRLHAETRDHAGRRFLRLCARSTAAVARRDRNRRGGAAGRAGLHRVMPAPEPVPLPWFGNRREGCPAARTTQPVPGDWAQQRRIGNDAASYPGGTPLTPV